MFFCGLQKLNTLNLRLFHSPSNPRNHFSTVLIETNWYTTSCKYYGCSGLTSVTIPNSVTSIGQRAFEGCSGLTSVINLSFKPQIIAFNTFYYLYHPTFHVIPGCGDAYRAADYWKNFTIIEDVPATASGDCGAEGDNVKWYSYEDSKILVISGSGAMADFSASNTPWYSFRESIESIGIQNGVTSIGDDAFQNCSGLTSVTIGNSVTSIGDDAFHSCSGLISLTIPQSVSSIGKAAFAMCPALATINVDSRNTTYAGLGNAIIEKATNTLVLGCKNTTIPNTVTSIGWYAFAGCKNLTEIEIPNSVTSIGVGAFGVCDNLTEIEIPNSVTNIGNQAFMYCSSLTSVTIGNSVTSIGWMAFWGCKSLTSVIINNSVIGDDMFRLCSNLTSVTIGNSVTSIGDGAFSNCSGLTSVTIPNSVTSIGSLAFYGCDNLTSVTNLSTTPQAITSDVFTTYGTLHVLPGCGDAYRAADYWKNFTIVEDAVLQYGEIALIDGERFENSTPGQCDKLTYTRNFKNTKMQALFVPFELSYDDWADNFVVYTLNNVTQYDTDGDEVLDATNLYVNKVKEGHTLKANHPYIIKAINTGEYTFSLSDATLYPSTDLRSISCSTLDNEYTFQGTYTPFSGMYEQGGYALANGQMSPASSPSATLNPYRWYMTIRSRDSQFSHGSAQEVKSFRIVVLGEDEDEETVITDLAEDAVPVEYVGVNGVRSTTPLKGINIVKMSDGSTRKMYIK